MIYPDCDMKRWEYCDNTVVLANADAYYTKKQTEDLIDDVSGMTPSEVQEMINESQYGSYSKYLKPASYKLTYQTNKKRGVYSF